MRDWRDDFDRIIVRDDRPGPSPDDWPDEPLGEGAGDGDDHYHGDYDCPESED